MTTQGTTVPRSPAIDSEPCPVARCVEIVGDRWSLLIVRDAFDGVCRFGDFQRSLGMARNILSERLRRLVDAGVLALQAASDGSAYQEYVLTPRGKSLFPVIVALRQWGEQQLFAPGERHSVLVDRRTQEPVPYMAPLTQDGRALAPDASEVRKLV